MNEDRKDIAQDWWITDDTPVRRNTTITYLIDGRTTLLEMCIHFLKAKEYIYLANWGMTAEFQMVRGADHRIEGDEDANAKIRERLSKEGLSKDDITFWMEHPLTVQSVLGHAVKKGVAVKVLLWDSYEIPFFSFYKPSKVCKQLQAVGVDCILDDSAKGLRHHQIESLHQKASIIDGRTAFVGGIDPMTQGDDFDRWDIYSHPPMFHLRGKQQKLSSHSWHDVQAYIEGRAVMDVEQNFTQRWNDVVSRHHWKKEKKITVNTKPKSVHSNALVQVVRTIPKHTYSFENHILQGIAHAYMKAFQNAQKFIYIENQYLWTHNFIGIDIPFLGKNNPEMEQLIHELAQAIHRGVHVILVLPDDPNVGRIYTDEGISRLRSEAKDAEKDGLLHIFTLACSGISEKNIYYRPIYVHGKIAIIDDLWATAGSGNLNNRGMRDDTEINVTSLDRKSTTMFRYLLWAEHLGIVSDDELFTLNRYCAHPDLFNDQKEAIEERLQNLEKIVGDFEIGLQLLTTSAGENLKRFKDKKELLGHLLPYLTQEKALLEGLSLHLDHGWVERS